MAQSDFLAWHPPAEHFVLRLEKLDLSNELIAAAPGQKEQKGLEKPFHGDILHRCLIACETTILFVHRRNTLSSRHAIQFLDTDRDGRHRPAQRSLGALYFWRESAGLLTGALQSSKKVSFGATPLNDTRTR